MKTSGSSKGWYKHSKDGRSSEEIFFTADAIRFKIWLEKEVDPMIENYFYPGITKEDLDKNLDKMVDELSKLQESKIDSSHFGHALFHICGKIEGILKRPLEFDEEKELEKKFKEKLIN